MRPIQAGRLMGLHVVRIASAEARAALAGADRDGRLTPVQHRSAKAHLRGLWTQCAVVEVSEAPAWVICLAGTAETGHDVSGSTGHHLGQGLVSEQTEPRKRDHAR